MLQALCEKGLVAMENSHRRIIAELEEKHRQEIGQLRHEKEQALAEETQATLAGTENGSNTFCLADIYFSLRFFKICYEIDRHLTVPHECLRE